VEPARLLAACNAPPQVFATALLHQAGLKVLLGRALDMTFAGYFGCLLPVGSRALGSRSQGGWIKVRDEGREIGLEPMQG